MADEEQLRILKQGREAWNDWRKKAGGISVDLNGAILLKADLSEANLSDANLVGADLGEANLGGANLADTYLEEANFYRANLADAKLSRAYLNGAYLHGANLCRADLTAANLGKAYLNGANLTGADLSWARLRRTSLGGADFSGADLSWAYFGRIDRFEANLSRATLYETVFADVDLSNCKGLESCSHRGPSPIDIRTLQRSGHLPPAFLRGVGLSNALIDGLPSLLGPNQFHSCFISYSSQDDEFVHRLHTDLQDKGVRCWFAPHDMKIGAKILDTLDEAIRTRQKVLLVLSEASIASDWVEVEVKKALAEERQRHTTVLFPVRLDDAVFATKEAWASLLRDDRNIGDFRGWKDHDAYQPALKRVLRDLQTERAPGAA